MANSTDSPGAESYGAILAEYLEHHSEHALYRASDLSRELVQAGLGPEDIIALHMEMLEQLTAELPLREQVRAGSDGHQFLLEVMIAYGVYYKEYLELRLADTLREADARLALAHEHSQELERIGREKEEILSVIAHELRTPLTAVQMNISLLERTLLSKRSDEAPRYLAPAREAIERLSRLTGDLVEASRNAPPTLVFSPIDLRPVVAQACRWVQPTAEAKPITLTIPPGDQPVPVYGNADALLSVVGNLLANAVRYTPAGGSVTVEQGGDSAEAWVVVRDTGLGMSPETQAAMFDKFYRGSEARQAEPRGLGLGLTLVQQLVTAHAGRIEVTSAPGKGSTFRVVLPTSPLAAVAG
jgi:signal transduction histidine kinase